MTERRWHSDTRSEDLNDWKTVASSVRPMAREAEAARRRAADFVAFPSGGVAQPAARKCKRTHGSSETDIDEDTAFHRPMKKRREIGGFTDEKEAVAVPLEKLTEADEDSPSPKGVEANAAPDTAPEDRVSEEEDPQ